MQVDNTSLPLKLQIRRQYLRRHGGESVLDCCQGSATIWDTLRQEFPALKYMGVDLKAKRGRHSIDSRRLLALRPLHWDIIDVDTYGDPWEHYLTALSGISKKTTVFLTYGSGMGAMGVTQASAKAALMLPDKTPQVLVKRVLEKKIDYILHLCARYSIILKYGMEYRPIGKTVKYYALVLEPTRKEKT